MKKKIFLVCALVLIFSISVFAGGQKEEKEKMVEGLDIAYVVPSTESQYWGQYLAVGVENACKDIEEKHGVPVSMTIYGPATEAETDAFLNVLETVISKKPDGIVLGNLIPDATAPLIEQAYAQGIYVNLVSIGAPADPESFGSLYDCDQPEQGVIAAEIFYDFLKKKGLSDNGTVGVHMSVVVPILEEKIQKFRDTLSELAPGLTLLETIYNENDVNNAIANVENQIATYGDGLVGFFGANNISGNGIVTGIKNAGLGSKVVSVAVDSDDLEIQALKEGNLDAIIVQTPYAQGYAATMNIYEYLVNGKNDPDRVNLSAKAVTQENMETTEFAALLNPLILKR